eukprot:gene12546-3679_t
MAMHYHLKTHLKENASDSMCLRFSPDDTLIAVGCFDGTVKVCFLRTSVWTFLWMGSVATGIFFASCLCPLSA